MTEQERSRSGKGCGYGGSDENKLTSPYPNAILFCRTGRSDVSRQIWTVWRLPMVRSAHTNRLQCPKRRSGYSLHRSVWSDAARKAYGPLTRWEMNIDHRLETAHWTLALLTIHVVRKS